MTVNNSLWSDSPDVVVPEHDEMSAQLQTRLLYEVSFPMTFEYLEQVAGVDVTGVLCDQLTKDYPTVSLELYSHERWRNSLYFIGSA